MADIRCPMCGRPNPEELDQCIFCQARLRPLVASQPPFNPDDFAPKEPQSQGESSESDWLAKIRQQQSEPKPVTNPFDDIPQALSSEEEVPDWLRSVRERTQKDGLFKEPPLGIPNLGVEPGSAEIEEDWLQNLRDTKVTSDESTPAEAEPAPFEQIPDWLINVSDAPTPSGQSEPGSDRLIEVPNQEETPVIPSAPIEPPVVAPPASPIQARKSRPKPVAPALSTQEAKPTSEPQPETPPQEPQGPQWEPGWSPEWLSNIEGKAAPAENLSQSMPALPETPTPVSSPSFEPPDWLSQLGTARSTRPVPDEKESTGEEEYIAPAELPNWVQEMRPVETIAPQPTAGPVRQERIEERGPLAGLKGVLPSEPTTTEIRRPPVYIPRLQVSERHQAHSELLSQLISSESEPTPTSRQPVISTQRILRMALAVVLLAAVLYPIISNSALFPLPDNVPQEVNWAYETVNSLTPNEAVLVVVDYEAAFAGEMEAAGSSVVDHIMTKGARMALISTNPVGQALSQMLMTRIYNKPEEYMAPYSSGEKFVNLGYLPGGMAGLAELVANPSKAAYYDINAQPAWTQPALNGVKSISDFSEILVISENVDSARAWLEQVGAPIVSTTSMVLVTSAQAAPILRAYVDSGQAQGMVTGLTGGAAYERLRNHPGLAQNIWDAYQAGTWMAVLLILGGSLVSVLWPMLQKRFSTTLKKEPSL